MSPWRKLREALRGVAVVTVTVFGSSSEEVDLPAIRANVRYILGSQTNLIVPCGNVGEFYSLTGDEWRSVVRAVVDEVQGEAAVMPMIGGSLHDALDMSRYARGYGADGVMFAPPHHAFVSNEGVYRYYMCLLDSVEIGAVCYVRNNAIPESVLLRLMQHPNMVGIKYGLTDVRGFANLLLKSEAKNVVWSCGAAELWAPMFFLCGAVGFTSGLANFAPRVALALYRALLAGDWADAMRIRSIVVPFEMLRARHNDANNVPAVKEAMTLFGLRGGVVRPPLTELCAQDRVELANAVARFRSLETG